MARVAFISPTQRVVIADCAAERDLLANADDDGRVVLDAAYYIVSGENLLLPEGISDRGADTVRRAFEAAAKDHAIARSRRGSFHIVPQ